MHILSCVIASVVLLAAVVIFPEIFCLDDPTTTNIPVGSTLGAPPEEKTLDLEELQELLEEPKIRFLMLDRKCKTLKKRKLKFRFLYTKAFFNNKQGVHRNCWVELEKSGQVSTRLWSPGGEIKVLIHGLVTQFWNDADEMINDQHIFEMGEEYGRHKEDLNVIVVDWTYLAAVGSYSAAAFFTRRTGVSVAEFLMKLHHRNNLTSADWEKVHLVGGGLGAHVSGIAGYQLQQLGAVTAGRITGLDPAGPKFDGPNGTRPDDVSAFLDKGDAQFVDIVHCNMGRSSNWTMAVTTGRFGSWVQAGHADFYPNGGHRQPNVCNAQRNQEGCSHNACIRFYINSIHHKSYPACRCHSWTKFKNGTCSPCHENGGNGTLMGDPCDKSASGKYYLAIHKDPLHKANQSQILQAIYK